MPMDSNREQGERLVCTVGTWNSLPAYSLDLWTNPQWGGCNTSGAVIQLFGRPPAGLVQAQEKEVFTGDIATGWGRPIRPLFYHQSNLLEYVWYSHGAAVPAVLYITASGFYGGQLRSPSTAGMKPSMSVEAAS